MNQPVNSPKTYAPFSSPFKDKNTNKWIGTNFMGVPKSDFVFKMKVYHDLPLAVGDKKITFQEFTFLKLGDDLYGIPTKKIKPNIQMKDCVNFFISDTQKIPVMSVLNNENVIKREKLLETITVGISKTKEFYAKHPPLPNQELKVFETTINVQPDGKFKVNNLTDKYFNGSINIVGKDFVNIYFPFDGQNKTFLVSKEHYHNNNDGSFSVDFIQPMYKTFPTKDIKEINKIEFQNKFKLAYKKSKPKER